MQYSSTVLLICCAAALITADRIPVRQCFERGQRCFVYMAPYMSIVESTDSTIEILSNRTILENIAGALNSTASCLSRVFILSGCEGLETGPHVISNVRFVSGFLNSEGAIDTIVAASSSQCFSNRSSLLDQTEAPVERCVSEGQAAIHSTGNICNALEGGVVCIKNELRGICGDTMAQLIQAVWDYFQSSEHRSFVQAILQVEDLSCWGQTTTARRYARAALPLYQSFRK